MMPRHCHADLIHAWAEGATVQVKLSTGEWVDQDPIKFPNGYEARIKPEKKPDVERLFRLESHPFAGIRFSETDDNAKLRCTFSGETGELISAEVLK